MTETIWVYENWKSPKASLLGRLYVDKDRSGKEIFSFEYSDEWLRQNQTAPILDPDLEMYRGRQFPSPLKSMFGIFSDSSPDRWGRLLMQRREAIKAHQEARKPSRLAESDYLMGVFDETRMGALRFSFSQGGEFESSDKSLSTPPWVSLRQLEAAAWSFEKDKDSLDDKWIKQLIAPGSSLGGARPKANVQDLDGSLWIAKFPSKDDSADTGAWEKVVHDLAELCGLHVPEAKLESFSSNGSTFLSKRFDRENGKRIHYSSAMALLGKTDGEKNTSYLDMASFIRANGSNPKNDLVELWKRIVFNMAVSNVDDHLRNHGFLLRSNGWELSPLFDVNPVPYGETLSLAVTDDDPTIDMELVLATSEFYGLSKDKAQSILSSMMNAVANNWRKFAVKNGLNRDSQEQMKPAFSASENWT